MQTFAHAHLNDVPDRAEIAASVANVQALLECSLDGCAEGLAKRADAAIAGAAEVWARQGADHDPDVMVLARELLLQRSTHHAPMPREEDRDQHGLIRSGPRTDAARGLTALARFPLYVSEDMWTTIRTLSADPVPTVRMMVADTADRMFVTNPSLMWEVLEDRAARDDRDSVLRAVARTAWRLRLDDDRALDLIAQVAEHAEPGDRRDSAISFCTDVAALGWLVDGDERARDLLLELCTLDRTGAKVISHMLHVTRTSGCFSSDDSACRARTFALCSDLADQGLDAMAGFDQANDTTPESDIERIRAGFALLDAIASQLFFASGTHDAHQAGDRPPTDREVRFADEAVDLVERLSAVPHPQLTHRLIESLGFVLDERPERAVHLMRRVITRGGRDGGYELESLAASEMVHIVERLLADHREVLQDPEALSGLREILEVFVDAGWPDAHRLAFGLEQIFR